VKEFCQRCGLWSSGEVGCSAADEGSRREELKKRKQLVFLIPLYSVLMGMDALEGCAKDTSFLLSQVGKKGITSPFLMSE